MRPAAIPWLDTPAGKSGRSDRVDQATSSRTLRADCGDRRRIVTGGAIVRAAGDLLGADYDSGHHAVVGPYDARPLLATVHRNGARGHSWRDPGELRRAERLRARPQRVPTGVIVRCAANGSKRLSIRGRNAGDCDARSADRARMADSNS